MTDIDQKKSKNIHVDKKDKIDNMIETDKTDGTDDVVFIYDTETTGFPQKISGDLCTV